jgi:activator of 2-hydroxyglutaryl-CoA dehydratase
MAALCTAENVDTVVFVGGFLDSGGILSSNLRRAINMWHPEITVVVPDFYHYAGAIGAALSLAE